MAFIYILYTSVIILILIVLYLSFDYYQMRKKLMEIPIKLQSELDEKMKIQDNHKMKLSILWQTQKNMEVRVVQIDQYFKNIIDAPIKTEFDIQLMKMMELNAQFTIDQINKSMKFIQEMKSQEK